jgi:hypothetical protein
MASPDQPVPSIVRHLLSCEDCGGARVHAYWADHEGHRIELVDPDPAVVRSQASALRGWMREHRGHTLRTVRG